MQSLDDRFKITKAIVSQSATTTDTGVSSTEKVVIGSRVYLQPGEAGNGKTFKWTLGGTKTGTAGNPTVKLYANGTAIATATLAQKNAVDWFCGLTCACTTPTGQKCISFMSQQGEETAAAYDAGTADLSRGGTLYLQIGSGHGSDSIQAEVCIVEMWDYGDMVAG
jgi:hypothetical protein